MVDADAFSDGVRTPVWVSSGGSPEFSSLAEPDFFDGEFFGVEILERALTPLFPTGDEISPAVGPNTVHSHDLLTPLIPMAQLTIPGQSDPPNPSPANQNPPGEGDSPEHLAGTQGSDGSADGQGGGAGGGGGGGQGPPNNNPPGGEGDPNPVAGEEFPPKGWPYGYYIDGETDEVVWVSSDVHPIWSRQNDTHVFCNECKNFWWVAKHPYACQRLAEMALLPPGAPQDEWAARCPQCKGVEYWGEGWKHKFSGVGWDPVRQQVMVYLGGNYWEDVDENGTPGVWFYNIPTMDMVFPCMAMFVPTRNHAEIRRVLTPQNQLPDINLRAEFTNHPRHRDWWKGLWKRPRNRVDWEEKDGEPAGKKAKTEVMDGEDEEGDYEDEVLDANTILVYSPPLPFAPEMDEVPTPRGGDCGW